MAPTAMKAVAAALLMLALAPLARAQQDFSRPGLYVTAGLAFGVEDYAWLDELNGRRARAASQPIAPSAPPIAAQRYAATTFLGAGLAAGWRVHPRLALEATFEAASADLLVDLMDRSDPTRPLRRQEVFTELSLWLALLQTKIHLLTGRFQPFALAGIGAQKATPLDRLGLPQERHGLATRLGGGLDVWISQRVFIDVHASHVFATGDTRQSDWTSVGVALGYRIGPPPRLRRSR